MSAPSFAATQRTVFHSMLRITHLAQAHRFSKFVFFSKEPRRRLGLARARVTAGHFGSRVVSSVFGTRLSLPLLDVMILEQ